MSHVVMPKKLAQALMDAGMHHFAGGGGFFGNLPSKDVTFGMLDNAANSGDGPPKIMGMSPISNFQATMPEITTQSLMPQIGMQEGNAQNVFQQQSMLAGQLLAQTQGQGPGQQLIAQQAGNNAAQQGALMASQRGASANAGLIGRQAAMAGAQGNQQALNAQAALQLQSQGALAQQQAAMANQAIQSQSVLQQAQAAQNQAINTASLGVQGINSKTEENNAANTKGIFGGGMGGAGSALTEMFSQGGRIPGQAEVGGDSEQNDRVPALLSPGEIVLPRSVTQSPDMEKKAVEFLRHLKSKKAGYDGVIEARKGKK